MPSPVRLLIACFAALGAFVALGAFGAQAANAQPAPAITPAATDDVFQLEASRAASGELTLTWRVQAGAYLYRDSIAMRQASGTALSLAIPAGVAKDDAVFGLTQVLEGPGAARVRVTDAPASGVATLTYQGCDGARGVCFPPVSRLIDLAALTLTEGDPALSLTPAQAGSVAETRTSATAGAGDDSQDIAGRVMALGLIPLAAAFIGFGLLLSLTPCVLPMVPIVSGMLARSGATTTARGFSLSLTYVLAMATAYGALGYVAGWSGQNLQMVLQTPWAIAAMSLVFVALALSMFGLYELRAPAWLTSRLSRSGGGARGSLAGAAMLGFSSALIVGPCVTPPLAGALLYVSQTGDVTRGAIALFALGLGMGAPLLALGLMGPRALPRSGPWLLGVNHAFGVIFLATAIYLAGRALPGPATLALWALLAIGVSVFLGAFEMGRARSAAARLGRAGGLVAAVYGVILLVGAASGGNDPFQPLARFTAPTATATPASNAVTVRTQAEFDQAMAAAQADARSVVVDFTADWCSICKEIDREVFQAPDVRRRLAQSRLIRIDVTRNDSDSRALMQRFAVVGPPAIILIKHPAAPIAGQPRIVGAIDRAGFLARLDQSAM